VSRTDARAAQERALFRRLPRLVDMVPFVELADGLPTPVEQLADRLWVKRDDTTDSTYGGNKVRKLEHVLAVAQRKGGPVLTAGAKGSHHVFATAVHAQRLGLEVEAVRFPQPDTEHVRAVDTALRALGGVRETWVARAELMPFALAARRVAVEREGGYAIFPGATSPLGALGYVGSALELVEQLDQEPDDVVVALGSGGSAVGLTIGLQLGGWRRARVVAVRTADAIVTNRAALFPHAVGTFALLALGGWRPQHGHLHIDRRWFGAGYGHPTEAGAAAIDEGARLGLALEPTYTAKAFAAALDLWRAGRRVVFVQTFAG
jgi:D-cysteine desulfhydrase